MHRWKEKRQLVAIHNYIEKKKDPKQDSDEIIISKRRIIASNGNNACYINSVLYLFLSNHTFRNTIIYNNYFTASQQKALEVLVTEKWDDRLYHMYYNLFKTVELSDIPRRYGEFGSPHIILIFFIDTMLNRNSLYSINYEFAYDIVDFSTFLTFINNREEGDLYGIIKSTKKTVPPPISALIEHELESHHFCSFLNVLPNKCILFDALHCNGTCTAQLFNLQQVFDYENYEEEDETIPKNNPLSSFQFFFIYWKKK